MYVHPLNGNVTQVTDKPWSSAYSDLTTEYVLGDDLERSSASILPLWHPPFGYIDVSSSGVDHRPLVHCEFNTALPFPGFRAVIFRRAFLDLAFRYFWDGGLSRTLITDSLFALNAK